MKTSAGGKKDRIKIGQIGIGHNHASEKMAALRKFPEEFEIVGISEPDPEWRRRRGTLPAYRGLEWMSAEQLLNTPGLRAVAVETDVRDLLAAAKDCVEAGMHIHMDKPAGSDARGERSLEDFRQLLENARGRGVTVQMGYMLRNNPAVEFALRAAGEGWLGRIFEIDCVMNRTVEADYRRWLSQFPGGAMYIFGSHMVDLVVAMMGKPRKITPFQRNTRPDLDPLHDNGLAVLEYRYATATVRSAVVEAGGVKRRQIVVCGDEGTIDIRPVEPADLWQATRENPMPMPALRMELSRPREGFSEGSHEVPLPAITGRYDDQMLEFARIIRGESDPRFSFEHELIVQETAMAAGGCSKRKRTG